MKNLFTLVLTLFFIALSNAQTEKANINTSRSNIKNKTVKPTDSLQQKANHNTARSNKNTVKENSEDISSEEMPNHQQKTNINTSRSNTKGQAKPADTDNLDTNEPSSKVKFKAGAELSDKVN